MNSVFMNQQYVLNRVSSNRNTHKTMGSVRITRSKVQYLRYLQTWAGLLGGSSLPQAVSGFSSWSGDRSGGGGVLKWETGPAVSPSGSAAYEAREVPGKDLSSGL